MDTTIENDMFVTKRSGELEVVSFDKILKRIKNLGNEVNIKINYTSLAMKVIDQLYDKISAVKIDELSAEQCASMSSIHPEYNVLAGRIIVSNNHKNIQKSFSETMEDLYNYVDKHDQRSPLVADDFIQVVRNNAELLNNACQYDRDYLIDYFGFKTLERAYLMRINKIIVERVQHMWMRVSIGIHGCNIDRVLETYNYMSNKYFTHATPTLFNSGTPRPQLSSCYLISMESDSIDGIYNTLKDCALISKHAGGIGLHIHNIRASGSHIRGTNGSSNGIVPMLRVFNNTAKYVDQCVHPKTFIYTPSGAIPIKNCISGITRIFNLNGEIETVQNVLEHSYEGEMLELYTMSNMIPPLIITPEHPVYSITNVNESSTPNSICNDLDRGLCQFVWKEAKEMTVNDYLVYKKPSYEMDFPELTEEVCYIYGLLLSGLTNFLQISDITQKYNASLNYNYFVNSKEKIDIVCNYFKTNNVDYEIFMLDNVTKEQMIIWKKNVNVPFRNTDFFNPNLVNSQNENKVIIGERWLFLPVHKIKAILKGLGNEIINRDFRHEVFLMQLRMGQMMDFSKEVNQEIGINYKDFIFIKIDNIKTVRYSGIVYDLQMKNEHNYLLEHGLVHNGGGKRNGSFAIYIEPWHADIELFLQMRKNQGDEELKARDLFYALWIPDLFMERVKSNGKWSLLCPDECPGLSDVYGEKFEELYKKYEMGDRVRKVMNARELWFQILDAQMETGTPYLLFKDSCNQKSNQKNLGTIKSSNLCTEIIEYSDSNETAVCNLASIALPTFVNIDPESLVTTFDYQKLHDVTKIVTYNLNRVIDVNFYPTEKTKKSNMRHRPIGIGVQGLADVFMKMGLPFISDEAKKINRDIFETIYHASVEQSMEQAIIDGPYETFEGSPASQGILQFDMWKVDPTNERYDWDDLKNKVKTHGMRNSLLLAPMPTASTSQILGFNECIEPVTSNIYSRKTLAGEFVVINKYLMNDLLKNDMWNEKIKNNIIANNGSVQHIDMIPQEIRERYKTVWELPMKHIIDMAADRGAFICQSQSLNLWIEDPNYNTLTSMHFYSWAKQLKTGIYYLRRRAKHQAQQFTIEPEKNQSSGNYDDDEICEMCSS